MLSLDFVNSFGKTKYPDGFTVTPVSLFDDQLQPGALDPEFNSWFVGVFTRANGGNGVDPNRGQVEFYDDPEGNPAVWFDSYEFSLPIAFVAFQDMTTYYKQMSFIGWHIKPI